MHDHWFGQIVRSMNKMAWTQCSDIEGSVCFDHVQVDKDFDVGFCCNTLLYLYRHWLSGREKEVLDVVHL